MKRRSFAVASLLVSLALLVTASSAFAATVSSNGVTLTYPDYSLRGPGLQSCEPWADPTADDITLTGVPAGATVKVIFVWSSPYTGSPNFQPAIVYSNVTGGTLVVPIAYPMDTTQWPVFNTATNERAIAVAAFVEVTAGGVTTKLISKQWWVRCLPPPRPFQGCTPGYWKQDQHFDSWVPTGYAPYDNFEAVFGVNASFDPHTLLDGLEANGGGEFALARHAVAALLNAAHPGVNYFYSAAQIIAGVQQAYATGNFEPFKTALDFANNAGCPLN